VTSSASIPQGSPDGRPIASLDELLPVFDFRETHTRFIASEPDQVWHALASVTMHDLRITKTLMAIRSLGRLTPLRNMRLVDGGPLQVLASDPPRGLVAGAVGRPWQPRPTHVGVASLAEFQAFAEAGWTKFVTDFRLTPVPSGTTISTETRGRSTSRGAKLSFGAYWLLIRPFSGLVRREMLAAVDRKAVSAAASIPRTTR
jgi:hypothetical protein